MAVKSPFAIRMLTASRTVVLPQLFEPTSKLTRPRFFSSREPKLRKSCMLRFLSRMIWPAAIIGCCA